MSGPSSANQVLVLGLTIWIPWRAVTKLNFWSHRCSVFCGSGSVFCHTWQTFHTSLSIREQYELRQLHHPESNSNYSVGPPLSRGPLVLWRDTLPQFSGQHYVRSWYFFNVVAHVFADITESVKLITDQPIAL